MAALKQLWRLLRDLFFEVVKKLIFTNIQQIFQQLFEVLVVGVEGLLAFLKATTVDFCGRALNNPAVLFNEGLKTCGYFDAQKAIFVKMRCGRLRRSREVKRRYRQCDNRN